MPTHYTQPNWAPIPSTMITEINQYLVTARDTWVDRDSGVWETGAGRGNRPPTLSYATYDLPPHIEQWMRTNLPIPENWTITIQRIRAGFEVPNHTAAGAEHKGPMSIHVDQLRESVYQFLLTDSGPVTGWYRKLPDGSHELVESVVFEKGIWYHLHTSIPHAVRGLNEDRIAVIAYKNARIYGFDGSTWDGIN